MDYWLIGELAFTGALVGLMYALVALGIVLVYKTSGVANFAQGAIAMTGGYATWAISAGLGLPMWAAIPLALAMMFALGMLIERAVLQHMIGQPVIMIAAIVLFNSRAGIIMRAVSDDQGASWSVGIRVERAIAMAWGLAAGTATASGILWGSIQGVDWSLSLLLMKALAIAILGGLDSIPGVLLAGLIVGVAESLATGIIDPLVGGGTRDIVASVIILVTLLVRPYGLFGREQIERV